MFVVEFRLNSYVFPFLRRLDVDTADYSMPIIAQMPADATTGLLAASASDAVEFWLAHARTYEVRSSSAGVVLTPLPLSLPSAHLLLQCC